MSELRKVKEFFHCGRKVKFLYHNEKLVAYNKPWNNYIKDGLIFQLDAFDPKSITEIQGIPDDAATANMGAEWRTPSPEEWQELVDNCTVSKFTTGNNLQGYRFTGRNGNYISFCVVKDTYKFDRYVASLDHCVYMTNSLDLDCYWHNMCNIACIGDNVPIIADWMHDQTGKMYNGFHVRAVSDTEGIDLGLPSGTRWADKDVGATNYYSTGKFFSFGETTEKSDYGESYYKYYGGQTGVYTKYNDKDGLTKLTPSQFTCWTDLIGGRQCVSKKGLLNINKGVVFDGSDYLSVPEFWQDGQYVEIVFKPEGENNNFTLFSNSTSGDIGARVWRVGQYDYKFGGHEYLSNSNITLEELQIVSCTIKKDNGPTIKPYDNSYFVNGVDVGRGDTIGGYANPLSIGNGLKGIIKSIRVYDHLLSEEERQANYKIDLMRFSNL